jgi:hypothetical protein
MLGDDCPLPADLGRDRYRAAVLARRDELAEALGSERALVFHGELLSVTRVAARLLEAARRPAFRTLYRRRFEAMTGIDCSPFYVRRQFQPLTAAALVEGFLEGPRAAEFRPGARYFFGHRIPD